LSIFDIWHYRLGYPNSGIVRKLPQNNKIPFESVISPYVCTYCQMGRSHKLPFPKSETVYTKPLELVAVDLWGLAPINTDYGFNYYISFIGAYSRYVWIYFLKAKSETYFAVLQFIAQAEKQTGCGIKVMQTDGGAEF